MLYLNILRDCEAIDYLRFCHLGQFFMEPSDYYDYDFTCKYLLNLWTQVVHCSKNL